jgi:pimeloyl-ACP methyl ester carboxylesterase
VLFATDAPVVLEHYAPILEVLAPERRAVAFEPPGFGFSTPSRRYRFQLGEQVDALAAIMDALAIEQATLAFSCVNALLALSFAVRHPARVDRLLLSQIPSADEISRWARRIDLKVLGYGVLRTPVLGQALMWAAPSMIADRWFAAALPRGAAVDQFAAISRRLYAAGGAFCLAALNQALSDLKQTDIGVSSVPTTILWGDADRTHRHTDKTSSLAWHPSVELIHWDDVGHCPDLERPDAFASLLRRSAASVK